MQAKKFPKHIERRAFLHGIASFDGWVLVCKDSGEWHIAWLEVFNRKSDALAFAAENKWQPPFRAERATLAVSIPSPNRK